MSQHSIVDRVGRPARRATLSILLFGLVAGGCAGAGSPASPTPPDLVRTPWEAEMANLEPEGTRSVESALRLFAMAFGPLPGVDPPPAEPGQILSGSPAVRAIRAHYAQLTPDQQAAVDGYLRIPEDAVLDEVPPTAEASPLALAPHAGGLLAVDVPAGFVGEVHAEIAYLRNRLAGHWGDFPNNVALYVIGSEAGAYTYFEADLVPADPGQFACRVFVTGTGIGATSEALHVSLAHEIFFCGAAYKAGTTNTAAQVPAWVWEGGAHYFAMEATSASFQNAWNRYVLEAASIPLFVRDYDALGFWSHIQYRFGGVYRAIAAALPEATSEERFVAAGASANDFLDTWAAGLFRDPLSRQGRDWNTDGPGLSPVLSTPRDLIRVGNDEVQLVEQQAYTNTLYVVESMADLVRFEFVGRARLGDTEAVDTTELGSAVFCVRQDRCPPCPEDLNPQTYPPINANLMILAVSGGMDGTSGSVSGEQLEPCATPSPSPTEDEFCRLWRALLAWAEPYADTDYELSQPWAAEIARRSQEMRPYAPEHLIDEVDLYIRVYGTYATAPEPINVPIVGPDAAGIADAFVAINGYCESQQPPPTPDPTPPPTPQPTPPPEATPTAAP